MYAHHLYPCKFPDCNCADELDCPQAQSNDDKHEMLSRAPEVPLVYEDVQ